MKPFLSFTYDETNSKWRCRYQRWTHCFSDEEPLEKCERQTEKKTIMVIGECTSRILLSLIYHGCHFILSDARQTDRADDAYKPAADFQASCTPTFYQNKLNEQFCCNLNGVSWVIFCLVAEKQTTIQYGVGNYKWAIVLYHVLILTFEENVVSSNPKPYLKVLFLIM